MASNDDDVGGGGYDDLGGGGVRRRLRRLDNSRRKLWRPKRYDDTTTKIDPRNRILEVSTTGDAALGGTVMSNQSLMLTVLHDCIRSGTAQVYVKIPLRRPKTSMSIAKTKDDDTKAFLKRVMDKLKELKTFNILIIIILSLISRIFCDFFTIFKYNFSRNLVVII